MTPNETSFSSMLMEARSTPDVVDRLLRQSGPAIDALATHFREAAAVAAVTVARGSSDHAASHFAYLMLTRAGLLVSSLPPSAITLHHAPLHARRLVAIAFSQSGRSPDLVQTMSALVASGATAAAFVNDVASPLARAVPNVIDLCAGPEQSVAATKSFIAQMVAGLRLYASWTGDRTVHETLRGLPQRLSCALDADWSVAVAVLHSATRLYVIARGAGLSVAGEMALKFKEVCGIQAEAYSAAEVRHGPMALIGAGYPVLVLAPRGAEQPGLFAIADELSACGAHVLLASPDGVDRRDMFRLPIAPSGHEMLDCVVAAQSFYLMVEALARARGHNPDRPPHLNKVTLTK